MLSGQQLAAARDSGGRATGDCSQMKTMETHHLRMVPFNRKKYSERQKQQRNIWGGRCPDVPCAH